MYQKERQKVGDYFVDVRRSYTKGKRTMVLIHGIGVTGNYFMPFAMILAQSYDVHVLDMPGYGKVPRPSHPLTPLEQADVAAHYIKKIGLSNAAIVGQSMGCQTAAHFAVRHPDLCGKLILIGPTVNKWERGLVFQAYRLLCDAFREPLKMNLLIIHDYFQMGVKAFFITSKYMISDHIEDTLVKVNVPTCIIRGEKDVIAPARWVEYLRNIPTNAEVRTIPKGPHNVQFTNAKELFKECEDFLNN